MYGIEERYRAKLLNGDGEAWLTEVLDEGRWKDESSGKEGRDPGEYLRDLSRHARKSQYSRVNFLKKPFLDACSQIRILMMLQITTASALFNPCYVSLFSG